jgi:cytochrome c biogenesis factor
VTRKPLIKLVWYGLYVVLFGGLLALLHRLGDSRKLRQSEAGEAA